MTSSSGCRLMKYVAKEFEITRLATESKPLEIGYEPKLMYWLIKKDRTQPRAHVESHPEAERAGTHSPSFNQNDKRKRTSASVAVVVVVIKENHSFSFFNRMVTRGQQEKPREYFSVQFSTTSNSMVYNWQASSHW